ncbi:MAG: uncharacterized protein KVP18_003946 [Porospora cf. gigantea A]|uniref:uncharacterized protein n=1 Tax=Porospora cf. gigantea A TaxID=2853593 RepID=UPI003559684A|nr:MAG: hypothetical protein KVP18_003946 [Porospora cf. gigantea A]
MIHSSRHLTLEDLETEYLEGVARQKMELLMGLPSPPDTLPSLRPKPEPSSAVLSPPNRRCRVGKIRLAMGVVWTFTALTRLGPSSSEVVGSVFFSLVKLARCTLRAMVLVPTMLCVNLALTPMLFVLRLLMLLSRWAARFLSKV